jgi:hypothetical protein
VEPGKPSFSVGEHRPAERAALPVRREAFQFRSGKGTVERVGKKRFEVGTLHSGLNFSWHHITCL